jgi:hypothetical protein
VELLHVLEDAVVATIKKCVTKTSTSVTLVFRECGELLQMNTQSTCVHRYVTTAAAAVYVLTLIHLVAVIP